MKTYNNAATAAARPETLYSKHVIIGLRAAAVAAIAVDVGQNNNQFVGGPFARRRHNPRCTTVAPLP